MGKVKQWAEDTAEKNVDLVVNDYTNNKINLETAKNNILKVDNVNMTGVDEDNVEEVLEDAWNKQNLGSKEESDVDIALNLEVESKIGK
tara:strand:+ start:170 stop:436 length:267 start_codon:yes stop_codon:yes gene_type:complete